MSKYDDLATYVREQTDADVVLVAVVGGRLGSGFSVQSVVPMEPAQIAALLRGVADDIELSADG
jgi:hypothetical protein